MPISVLAYTAATVVAIDRVNSRVHFTSDVVAGAFIGTGIGASSSSATTTRKRVLSKAGLEVVLIRRGPAARLRF